MKKEKPIKSPFMPANHKVVRRDNNDLVDTGKEMLARFLMKLEKLDVPIETAHLGGFFAGYQAGLISVGLPKDMSQKITNELLDEVERIKSHGCGECDACKAAAHLKPKRGRKSHG